MKKFFIGCALDHEAELESEIQEIWPFLLGLDGKSHCEQLNLIERVPGGLLIENSLHLGLQLNLFSKLANRILLRIAEFRVRDFPKLFQKLQSLKSEPLLQSGRFRFEIAASRSRLNHEKRIQEVLNQVFGPEEETSSQALFLRIHDDLCSVSLDSSGAHLHKRSERLKSGAAPVRETLAAFCGRKLMEGLHFSQVQDVILADPMAGTGTLLLETAQLYQLSPRDDFPFLDWKQTPKLLRSPSLRSGYPRFPMLFRELWAADKDSQVLALAEERLRVCGHPWRTDVRDLAQAGPIAAPGSSGSMKNLRFFAICNPPYGERLKADMDPGELLGKIQEVYQPERLGILLPEKQARELPNFMPCLSRSSFKNGGIQVQFVVFSRI